MSVCNLDLHKSVRARDAVACADVFKHSCKAFMDYRIGSPRRPVWMAAEKASGKADLIDQ